MDARVTDIAKKLSVNVILCSCLDFDGKAILFMITLCLLSWLYLCKVLSLRTNITNLLSKNGNYFTVTPSASFFSNTTGMAPPTV